MTSTAWCHGIGEWLKKAEVEATSKREGYRARLEDIHKRTEEIQLAAAMNFAAANGWQVTPRGFWVSTLINPLERGARREDEEEYDWAWQHELFDHPVYRH